MNNNGIIEYKDNILTKIKKFIFNLFKKDKNRAKIQTIENIESKEKQNNFVDDIIIKQNEEELELLNLQKLYKDNFIYEEEIPEEKKRKLIELYKEQNNRLREELMREKVETQLLIKNLKNS